MNDLTPQIAALTLRAVGPNAVESINHFARETLITRGGRIGSGMGTLLEALWGYYANKELAALKLEHPCEIGWMASHDYNDFACVQQGVHWDPLTRQGELLRIEVKSMNAGADESKAHFDELIENLREEDLLLVLVWSWAPIDEYRFFPYVKDSFLAPARPVAHLRDALHIARGGSFVHVENCPDGCSPADCKHSGEPLNASGSRERATGPASKKPANSSFGANFGGMVRMLKTDSPKAAQVFKDCRQKDEIAHEFISFIHRNYPAEERNRYSTSEWRQVASELGVPSPKLSRDEIITILKRDHPGYRELLRDLKPVVEEAPSVRSHS